jgi:3-oxoacyl-(acyl-carrier-protein) synthase
MGTLVEASPAFPGVSIAGCGAVSALGLGIEPLARALRANASGLRPCERLAGQGYQSTVAGWVPEEVLEQLRAEDPDHADARAFLFAESALKQAEQSTADLLGARPQADDGASRGVVAQVSKPAVSPTSKPAARAESERPRTAEAPAGLETRDTADLEVCATVPPTRRGLVLSTTKADIEALERVFHRQACSSVAQRHIHPALLAADLAAAHGIGGPRQCVSAACISGLLAIQQGAALIRRGAADLVFVVGVDLVSQFVLSGFTALKSLDPTGCRPFDRCRTGLSLGEGAGAMVLARSDVLPTTAVQVTGWGTSNDANHLTGPSRDGSGLALAISRALAKAGVAPDAIDYINAHGTGTPFNDNMESLALRAVFGERVPPFSASKGMLGHTLGAAGVLETILCLLAVHAQMLPGTPRLQERDPVAPASLIESPRPATRVRRILKVNCGFGGTNGAVVLEATAA